MRVSFGIAAAIFGITAMGAASPAQAQRQKVFDGIIPTNILKAWAPNEWHVWAMPDGSCLALSQEPNDEPFKFWGFRQRPGTRIDLIFGSIAHARPRTLQMSFNDGGKFDYDARVVHYVDWDAYAISLQSNALSVFHDQTIIDSYVNGVRVFSGITNSMRNLSKAMRKCLEWQAAR